MVISTNLPTEKYQEILDDAKAKGIPKTRIMRVYMEEREQLIKENKKLAESIKRMTTYINTLEETNTKY